MDIQRQFVWLKPRWDICKFHYQKVCQCFYGTEINLYHQQTLVPLKTLTLETGHLHRLGNEVVREQILGEHQK